MILIWNEQEMIGIAGRLALPSFACVDKERAEMEFLLSFHVFAAPFLAAIWQHQELFFWNLGEWRVAYRIYNPVRNLSTPR